MGIDNVYNTDISFWYDYIVNSCYYNYDEILQRIVSLIGAKRTVLELGIGTGLTAEKLAEAGFHMSGVDFSKRMLDKAKERLKKHTVPLTFENVTNISLGKKFEVALSVGGVWSFTRGNTGEFLLVSHLKQLQDNIKAIKNVYNHLEDEGLFLLNIQNPHQTIPTVDLGNNVEYYHEVELKSNGLLKDYYVVKDNKKLAHQQCHYRVFKWEEAKKMLRELGFELVDQEQSDNFIVLRKSKT